MSDDFKLPELPSDEELGIDGEDLADYVEDEGSELTPEERRELLGEAPSANQPPRRSGGDTAKTEAPAPAGSPPPEGGAAAAPAAAPPTGAPPAAAAEGDAGPPPGGAPPDDGEPPKKEKPAPPPREPEAPRTRWRGAVTLLVLLAAAWFSAPARSLPRPAPANAPDTAFSSARAMTHLVEIARAAHPPGSPEHDRVRAYILDELRGLGLEPSVQTTTSMIGRDDYLRAVTVRNIVARIPGTDNTGALLVTAHYDGRQLARAAADDGSGVVSILESLRALRGQGPLRNDLIVLITDAEELGLLGARAFVAEHPWMEDVQAVISVEMRGGGGPSIMFETGAEYGWIVRRYQDGAPRPVANSLTYEVYRRMPNDTDFTPFREAGKQGLNFAGIGRAHVYHQQYDDPEHLSEATLQHHGLNTLSMIRTLGDADLSAPDAPDAVYFTLPVLGMVVYPAGWVWPITGAVVVLWGLAIVLARRKGIRATGVAAGLGVGVLSLASAWFAGGALFDFVRPFHPEYGALHGSAFHTEVWYVLALAAFAVFLVTALHGLVRTRFGLRDLALGISLLVIPALAAATYVVPLGAMNVQWPAAAFAVALLASALTAPAGRLREMRWLLFTLAGVVTLAFLAPLADLLWLAMTIRMASALGVLLVFTVLLMLPALDALREPNAYAVPLLSLVATAAFVGVGLMQASPSPERPLPTTLVYTLDRDSGEALWLTDAPQDERTPGTEWAAARTSANFGNVRSLEPFWIRDLEYSAAPAPAVAAPAPSVAVVEEGAAGGVRTVRVGVRSAINAEMLLFKLPVDGPPVVAVNGKPLPEGPNPSLVEHWGRPDSLVTLDFQVPEGAAELSFDLIEHSLRPGELLGAETFRREPDQAPNITRLSDRFMARTAVLLPLGPEEPGA